MIITFCNRKCLKEYKFPTSIEAWCRNRKLIINSMKGGGDCIVLSQRRINNEQTTLRKTRYAYIAFIPAATEWYWFRKEVVYMKFYLRCNNDEESLLKLFVLLRKRRLNKEISPYNRRFKW